MRKETATFAFSTYLNPKSSQQASKSQESATSFSGPDGYGIALPSHSKVRI